MTLHDTIQADASTVFCNANDFAEPVTYYKRDGSARVIQAIVLREGYELLAEANDAVVPMLEIHVANSDTLGISSDELNTGGDQLGIPTRVGQPELIRAIVRLVSHDEGMLVLQCR
jgi:hypothetical protein